MTGTYCIAGLNIRISSFYEDVHQLCAEYQINGGPADLTLETTQGDVDFERGKAARESELEGHPERQFSDGYLETLAVYRQIAERMPWYDTVLFHGSCVAVDGEGYLFTAKSGTGKSTHTRLWREILGDRAVMINDDKPLIRVSGGRVTIYGTPWNGKHRLSTNTSVPLKGICVLERGEKNDIRPVSVRDAYPWLIQQVYRPLDREALARTAGLIDALAASVSLWRLKCNISPEAARLAYNTMKG